jgi:fatty acid-binding protein DegV
MKIGLVVDSSCDLPRSFFEEDGVELMPTTLRMGDQVFEDIRNEQQTIQFHGVYRPRPRDGGLHFGQAHLRKKM